MKANTLEAVREFERKVRSVVLTREKPEGWLVTLECGHESWRPTWPSSPQALCAECVNETVATYKKRKV